MRDVASATLEAAARGEAVALGTVIEVRRSAPRPPGSKMAVLAGGRIVGSVSGGCVEGAVFEASADVVESGQAARVSYGFVETDGWEVGLPCGGEIDVLIERFDSASPQSQFLELVAASKRAVLVTVLPGAAAAGQRLLLGPEGVLVSTIGDSALAAAATEAAESALWGDASFLEEAGEASLFVDVAAPPPRLLMFGAGEYAQALSFLALGLGWSVVVCDPRSQFATQERFPGAVVIAGWPQDVGEQVGTIDPATSIVVLTHDPKLDDAALAVALNSDAGYIGAMGSRRATADRLERLREQGISEDRLVRLAAPIGLDLGGTSAADAALSILSEIVALRHGRAGGRLSRTDKPIHG